MPVFRKAGARWCKWHALSLKEQLFFLRMMATLPLIWLAMRIIGVRRLIAWAEASSEPCKPSAAGMLSQAIRKHQLTKNAARIILPEGSCLPQSIALCKYLRKKNFDARIKIGVNTTGKTFTAHAWVEVGNHTLDKGAISFRSFTEPTANSGKT